MSKRAKSPINKDVKYLYFNNNINRYVNTIKHA